MAKSYRGGIPFARKYAPPGGVAKYVPERIFLSLNNGAECTLNEGDEIKKYEKIIGASENSPAVFAGVGGKVEHIYRIGSRVDITLLTDENAEATPPFDAPEKGISELSECELRALLLERGITPPKKGRREVRCLTVDCSASPYNDSRLFICRSFPEKIVLGAKILMKLIGARSCNFAIPRSDLNAAECVYGAIPKKSEMFKVVLIKDKLPASVPNLTVSAVTGTEINAAKDVFDSGYPVVSPLLCLACYRALVDGIPFCEGYVTVAELGGEVDVFRLPFGAPLKAVAAPRENERVIRAENLYGAEISGETMTERTEALAVMPALPTKEGVALECIGCRRCTDVCPALISPIGIFSALEKDECAPIVLTAAGCFECRSCTYICPSDIPLAESIIKFRRDSGLTAVDTDRGDTDYYDDTEVTENER